MKGSFLCAKYSYKDDIAVKQKEAFEDGQQQKAIEAAILLIKEYKETPEVAAQKMNAPLEKVLELIEQITKKA